MQKQMYLATLQIGKVARSTAKNFCIQLSPFCWMIQDVLQKKNPKYQRMSLFKYIHVLTCHKMVIIRRLWVFYNIFLLHSSRSFLLRVSQNKAHSDPIKSGFSHFSFKLMEDFYLLFNSFEERKAIKKACVTNCFIRNRSITISDEVSINST